MAANALSTARSTSGGWKLHPPTNQPIDKQPGIGTASSTSHPQLYTSCNPSYSFLLLGQCPEHHKYQTSSQDNTVHKYQTSSQDNTVHKYQTSSQDNTVQVYKAARQHGLALR
jgi:hypothetical protein